MFKKKKAEKQQEKKNKKSKKTKKGSVKTCLDLLPIKYYDDDLAAFKTSDGYMDIKQIISRDIENMSDDELQLELINLTKVFKTVGIDMKFVSMNFPLNTAKQRSVLRYHYDRAEDEVRRKWLARQIDELNRVDSGILTRSFYIFYYAKNENELLKNRNLIEKYTGVGYSRLTTDINKIQKIHILTKLLNMNTIEDIHSELEFESNIIEKKDDKYDENLISLIQPKGGISFKEPSYVQLGDGYVRCLHVYQLPTYINDFWLIDLFNRTNCICTFDVSSKDINEVKKNINKSISEEQARSHVAKNYEELYDAQKRSRELQDLYDNLSRLGEVIKLVDFRIFVKGKTLAELEERCKEITKNLEGDSYKVTTLLNEQKTEFMSLFEPYKITHDRSFMLKGLALTSEQLASGFPFNFSELLDDQGSLLGFTKTGGVVVYDPFAKTSKRKHYNAIVCGDMGSGKSTHLKKMFKFQASIGSFVRTFDVSGEFTNITKEFGGKIIKCNGAEGMLNPLEILKSEEDNFVSYSNHISKLQSFFKCIISSMDDELKQELANQLQLFYSLYDLVPGERNEITGLPANKYPTLSNFKEFLRKSIFVLQKLDRNAETNVETNLNVDKARNLNSLLGAVENLVNNYGNLFDGHTTIDNITKEKVVTFDISSIKDLGNIFTAQMQNLVSLCWDNAVVNGSAMKEIWDNDKEGEIKSEDYMKFMVLIDESHRWVNTSMPQILDMIIRYEREARKYFAGIVLASQSVRDFMPEASDKDLEKIRVLFELSQYKWMFKQDSSAKEHIKNIFGHGMTFSQVERIPFLEVGETVLSIAGDMSIELKEWLSPEYEEKLFAGGK